MLILVGLDEIVGREREGDVLIVCGEQGLKFMVFLNVYNSYLYGDCGVILIMI